MYNYLSYQSLKSNKGTPFGFHVMSKPHGPICNLDCRYCYYLPKENLYQDSSFKMSDEVLNEFTLQYIQSQQLPVANFAWQGGEPTLMGVNFFRQAVEYQHKYRRPGMTIHNALQTNATLIDDEWAQFFKENEFLVGISLDGPKQYHDAYRVDKGGRPTFDRVLSSLDILKKHKVNFNILACVHTANADHPLEVYRFFRDQVGARYIQFIPVVERNQRNGGKYQSMVSRRSVYGKQYGHFLIRIFDEWILHDVGDVYVQLFDAALGVWLGQRAGLCAFEENCGLALALEHNGDLFACDHFVEPDYRLGNIRQSPMLELVNSSRQTKFGSAKRESLPAYCKDCNVLFMCNGGCPKNRFMESPDGEPGLNYLCEGYRSFFQHINRPMKLMAALVRMGRPPADVMRILMKEGYRGGTGPLGTRRLPKKNRRGRRSSK